YQGPDENLFLLMAQPPERPRPEEIPPREYIFVLDVSGSMNGFPLETAKKLLTDLIHVLRPTDTFNIEVFADGSRTWAETSLPATPENLQRALRFIGPQRGGGGTERRAAMELSFTGFDVYDVEPGKIPDLFARRPVVVFGKWRGRPQGTIELRGRTGGGSYRASFSPSEAPLREDHRALRYLWARTRIAQLSDF